MANRKVKLTKREVDAAVPMRAEFLMWDTDLPGFGCKIHPSGRKTYFVYYRTKLGEQRRPAIGLHGVVTPDEARNRAREILRDAALGKDPSAEAKAKKAEITFEAFANDYINRHAIPRKKARSVVEDRRNLTRHIIPRIGSKRIGAISRADIARFHGDLSDTPGAANRCLALLSKMFNLAELWSMRPDQSNPCRHVEKFKERKIERYLSSVELARLGKVLRETERKKLEPMPVIHAIRLLLFTGCRKEEILALKWDYVDFETKCLRLPDSKTGAKVVYLNPPALELLQSIQRMPNNPYVLPGKKHGQHLVNLGKPWRRIREKAQFRDVRIHDLRHSFASIGASAGLGLPIVGALLGHKEVSTTQRYAHLHADPLRAANDAIGAAIEKAVNGNSNR